MLSLTEVIESTLGETTGTPFRIASSASLGGGCIHNARKLTGEDGRLFFLKQNQSSFLESFQAEARSLTAIGATGTIRVPEPVATCSTRSESALVLEFLPIGNHRTNWHSMGKDLARLHRATAPAFGWGEDNWIGPSRQFNAWNNDWVAFFRSSRLEPQIRWAREKGLKLGEADALLRDLTPFFNAYTPSPSLLHGDLWAGNAGFLKDGTPVIYDPASYYGDREADLALTELFGGFPAPFYEGYTSQWPLDAGYSVRKDLYNLSHLLNHFTLFGGGYGRQAETVVRKLLEAVSRN